MPEKNRFSRLLKHLLTTAEIKNYTLAQQLSYDVSYISKWDQRTNSSPGKKTGAKSCGASATVSPPDAPETD